LRKGNIGSKWGEPTIYPANGNWILSGFETCGGGGDRHEGNMTKRGRVSKKYGMNSWEDKEKRLRCEQAIYIIAYIHDDINPIAFFIPVLYPESIFPWIPAFAGMTEIRLFRLFTRSSLLIVNLADQLWKKYFGKKYLTGVIDKCIFPITPRSQSQKIGEKDFCRSKTQTEVEKR
jgi:hypothetical protein